MESQHLSDLSRSSMRVLCLPRAFDSEAPLEYEKRGSEQSRGKYHEGG